MAVMLTFFLGKNIAAACFCFFVGGGPRGFVFPLPEGPAATFASAVTSAGRGRFLGVSDSPATCGVELPVGRKSNSAGVDASDELKGPCEGLTRISEGVSRAGIGACTGLCVCRAVGAGTFAVETWDTGAAEVKKFESI
jgi:hypothetical protein